MRTPGLSFVYVSALAACSGATGNPPPPTDGAVTDSQADSSPPGDTGTPGDSGTPGDTGMGGDTAMAACGTERPDLSMTPASEGLVIAADGTIYSSRSGGVARTRPGMPTEANWVRLTGATTVWGLALDVANRRLYVGSPGNATVFAVDYTADPPTSTAHLAMAGQPNGLTMGPDGALYYSDFAGGHVYRVEAAGMRTRVTRTPIAQANGLAFAPDRTLYVNGYGAGQVFRLTLDAMGAETERAMVATGAGGADGLALDAIGRLYVTAQGSGSLLRYNADGTGRTVLRMGMTSPANVEFGAGSLNCSDIYIATGGRPGVVMVEGDTNGAAVPWHR